MDTRGDAEGWGGSPLAIPTRIPPVFRCWPHDPVVAAERSMGLDRVSRGKRGGSASDAARGEFASMLRSETGAARCMQHWSPVDDGHLPRGVLPAHTRVVAWGRGDHGVLGLGDGLDRPWPSVIPLGLDLGLVRIRTVSSSWYHCAAVTEEGLVYTWGSGADGALGHGDS